MENKKAILIVAAVVNKDKMEDLTSYLQKAGPLTDQYGGKGLARYKTLENISGDQSPEILSVTEFPSAETIKVLVNSAEYKALDNLRSTAFTKLNMIISESM